uniref:C2H2-type domain-containing protein n=1 Tax=Plectus sambesii TaxID=2011161 RepID=A0A914WY13_9BILA
MMLFGMKAEEMEKSNGLEGCKASAVAAPKAIRPSFPPLFLPPGFFWPPHSAFPLFVPSMRPPSMWLPRPLHMGPSSQAPDDDHHLSKPSNPKTKQTSPSVGRHLFDCNHCHKTYDTTAAFHQHLRTHTHGCECPVCGKTFSRHWLLQGHIRTHTGEKPFKCPICAKSFADKSNLRAHIQIHSGVKPFKCRRCGKSFALKSYLSKHEESACFKPGAAIPLAGFQL